MILPLVFVTDLMFALLLWSVREAAPARMRRVLAIAAGYCVVEAFFHVPMEAAASWVMGVFLA
jgi:hypothetical protein